MGLRAQFAAFALLLLLGFTSCTNQAAKPESESSGCSELLEEPAIPLARAIELARERAPDERFLHAELGRTDGRADCLIAFWGSQGWHFLTLDARNGSLLNEGVFEGDSETTAQMARLGALTDSSSECTRAIAVATDTLPGSWARMIDLERDSDPLVIAVEVVAGEDVREVRVGAADGRVLPGPATRRRTEERDEDASVPSRFPLASAIERAQGREPGMVLLEAGDDPYSRARPRDWEVLLAKPDEQLRLRIDGHSGEILRAERESTGEIARALAASTGLFEAARAIDAALEAVRSVAPDAKAIAVLLANRQKGLVYQVALTSSSGSRVVEVSAKGGALLSVETVEAPDPMKN